MLQIPPEDLSEDISGAEDALGVTLSDKQRAWLADQLADLANKVDLTAEREELVQELILLFHTHGEEISNSNESEAFFQKLTGEYYTAEPEELLTGPNLLSRVKILNQGLAAGLSVSFLEPHLLRVTASNEDHYKQALDYASLAPVGARRTILERALLPQEGDTELNVLPKMITAAQVMQESNFDQHHLNSVVDSALLLSDPSDPDDFKRVAETIILRLSSIELGERIIAQELFIADVVNNIVTYLDDLYQSGALPEHFSQEELNSILDRAISIARLERQADR